MNRQAEDRIVDEAIRMSLIRLPDHNMTREEIMHADCICQAIRWAVQEAMKVVPLTHEEDLRKERLKRCHMEQDLESKENLIYALCERVAELSKRRRDD